MLLPELASAEVVDAAARIRAAVERLDLGDADVVAIVSPHATKTGLYHGRTGSLAPMGVAGIDVEVDTADDLLHDAARDGGIALMDEPFDHGIVVPLRMRVWDAPVVPIGIAESATSGSLGRVTATLEAMARVARIAVVASVNGSAGLLPRAPLTKLEGAEDAEKRLLEMIATDVGALATRALGLAQQGGSCAAGPLTVLGRLFQEHVMEVSAHEAPVGVGYLVAQTT